MDPAEYERMYDLEDSYWWFRGRKRLVLALLDTLPACRRGGARLADLGCGTGLMLAALARRQRPMGVDFSPLALQFSRKRGARELVRADVTHLPLRSETFDVVTALDLAEHVEDDTTLMAECRRILKPGGTLVLTVPAHPGLWSEHDETLHHCRRYTRGRLRRAIDGGGLCLRRMTYAIAITAPVVWGFRLLQRLRPRANRPRIHLIRLPRWANALLEWTVRVEGFLIRWVNLPFGITLVALADKPRPTSTEPGHEAR